MSVQTQTFSTPATLPPVVSMKPVDEDVRRSGLLRRASAGERAALAELAEEVLPRARRLARGLGAGAHADDIAQLATLQVLRRCSTVESPAAFRRWADRVTVRIAFRFLGQERKRQQLIDAHIEPPEVEATGTVEPLREQLPRDVDEYLGRLPAVQRQALVLRHVLGYALTEIAALTETSANTVKARLYHGRKAVRAAIEQDLRSSDSEAGDTKEGGRS